MALGGGGHDLVGERVVGRHAVLIAVLGALLVRHPVEARVRLRLRPVEHDPQRLRAVVDHAVELVGEVDARIVQERPVAHDAHETGWDLPRSLRGGGNRDCQRNGREECDH